MARNGGHTKNNKFYKRVGETQAMRLKQNVSLFCLFACLFDMMPYYSDRYLRVLCIHYHIDMIRHGKAIVEPVVGTGWSKSMTHS